MGRREEEMLRKCQLVAVERNGLCISTEYKDRLTDLEWHCNVCGKNWFASWQKVKGIKWCPCQEPPPGTRRKYTIEDCKQHAIQKNGRCLSTIYIGSSVSLEWECNVCGNQWKNSWSKIKGDGQWCRNCSGKRKYTIEECKAFAVTKNGLCLSEECKDCFTHLQWFCNVCRKEWPAVWHHIQNGKWCPNCQKHRTERLVGEILSEMLPHMRLEKAYPQFLCNPIFGRGLELDLYDPAHNFAVEVNGIQHYKFTPYFHSRNGEQDFIRQQEKDHWKAEQCKINGIMLLIVPHTYDFQDEPKLRQYLKDSLVESGIICLKPVIRYVSVQP